MKAREMQRLRVSFCSQEYTEQVNEYLKALKRAVKLLIQADKEYRKRYIFLRYTSFVLENTINFIKNTLHDFHKILSEVENSIETAKVFADEINVLNNLNSKTPFETIYITINKSICTLFYISQEV